LAGDFKVLSNGLRICELRLEMTRFYSRHVNSLPGGARD
jgi:hypothetical protein